MSAYKKLNSQDLFVLPYNSKKSWSSKESEFESYGIRKIHLTSGSTEDLVSGSSAFYIEKLNYSSINHLYYSNFSGSIISGSYDNYILSSYETGSRNLMNEGTVFSFPRDIVGEKIEPFTFNLLFVSSSLSGSIIDDGEGKLILTGSNILDSENTYVGDIIYPHGLCVITDLSASNLLQTTTNYTGSWESNFTLYNLNVYCRVLDLEYNTSMNPTTVTGSKGDIKSFATGSDFRPYITGLGLYNDANQLIAVAKFGQPIPKISDTDMVFVLKMDM